MRRLRIFGKSDFFPKAAKIQDKPQERSFTIIETLAALSIMLPVVIETVSTQGSIINNNLYMRRMTEATWLAKRIMSQVEYNYEVYPIDEIDGDRIKGEFKLDPSDSEFDYTYEVSIKEWKLPIFDLLLQGGPKNPEEETNEDVLDQNAPQGGGAQAVKAVQAVKRRSSGQRSRRSGGQRSAVRRSAVSVRRQRSRQGGQAVFRERPTH